MTEMTWRRIILIPVFCYVPAFFLVFLSFYLFKPSIPSTSSSPSLASSPSAMSPSPSSTTSSPQATNNQSSSTPPEPSVYTELIKVSVESEVRKQSEQAAKSVAKDEIDKLKADYKGDVFVQFAFPVLFAIASIFAAFAVKDIFTEILNSQERSRIKTDIETNLRTYLTNDIVPKVVAEKKQEIIERLDDLQGYTHWLEHQILNILINQTIDELKKNTILLQTDQKFSSAIEKLSDKSIVTLEKSSVKFRQKYFKDIKKLEESVLKIKLTSIGLSTEVKNTLISTFSTSSEVRSKPEIYQGQSIFQAQMGLLRVTLSKLKAEGENSSEIMNLLDEIDREISTDPGAEHENNVATAIRLQQNDGVSPPSWYS